MVSQLILSSMQNLSQFCNVKEQLSAFLTIYYAKCGIMACSQADSLAPYYEVEYQSNGLAIGVCKQFKKIMASN